jgi:hypothetical protein
MSRWCTILIATILAPCAAFAAEPWAPKPNFKLENANYVETLTWVSGFSYALTETAKISKSGAYCLPPQGPIGSKELIEILNATFPGQTISAESASAALLIGVRHRFPCK